MDCTHRVCLHGGRNYETEGMLAAKLTCLTGTDPSVANDLSEITAVRAAVDAACPCTTYDGSKGKTHAKYVTCASGIITDEVGKGNLRTQCKATVKKYYSVSTCGVPAKKGDVPCIKKSAAGKVTCSIKPSTKCAGVPCASFSTCIDAADTTDNGIIGIGDSGACASTPTPTPAITPTAIRTAAQHCGDGSCNFGETCATCPLDCFCAPPPTQTPTGPHCGDGLCNNNETCATCGGDCPCAAICKAGCDGQHPPAVLLTCGCGGPGQNGCEWTCADSDANCQSYCNQQPGCITGTVFNNGNDGCAFVFLLQPCTDGACYSAAVNLCNLLSAAEVSWGCVAANQCKADCGHP
jgi:hypothetical protein